MLFLTHFGPVSHFYKILSVSNSSAFKTKLLCNFIEITLRHGCSPVYLLHIFRKPFPKNTSGELHLDFLWGYLKRKTALFLLTIIRCLINILRETKEGCIQNALGQILLWLILQIEISNIIFLKLIIFQLNYDLLFPFQKILNNINR